MYLIKSNYLIVNYLDGGTFWVITKVHKASTSWVHFWGTLIGVLLGYTSG